MKKNTITEMNIVTYFTGSFLNNFLSRKVCLIGFLFLTVIDGFAQPGAMSNNTDVDGSYANNAMTLVGLGSNNQVFTYKEIANATTSSGTKFYQFNADAYFNTWNFNNPTYNSVQTASWSGGAGYNGNIKMNSTTSGSHYTFNIRRGSTSYANQSQAVLETSYSPTGINSYSTPSGIISGQTASGTVTLASALNTNEFLYVSWSTDGFASSANSGVVATTFSSGSTYNYNIPATLGGVTVTFYPFTSVSSSVPTFSDAPLLTLRMRSSTGENNTGAYSTYSVANLQFNGTTNSLWSVASNWNSGITPSITANLGTVIINANCTLDQNATVGSITVNVSTIFTASDATPRTLTIAAGGSITNNGTFTAATGTVAFAGTGTVTGTVGFNAVTLAGGVNFGLASTIGSAGSLQINAGGFVNTNAPAYGASSTLIYNSGDTYGRSTEWSATSGAGYPGNVQIGNGVSTTLDLGANSGAAIARRCAGSLKVSTGSTLSLNVTAMSQALTIKGKYTNSGATILSTVSGGDLKLEGDMDDNGTFTANTRAIFFEGANNQTINSTTDPLDIDVMRIGKSGGEVILAQNLLVDETADPIQFTTTTSVLNLNGKTATFGKSGTASGIIMNASSKIKGSASSSLSILGTGAFGTIYFDQTTPGTTNVLNSLTINRTSGTGTPGVILGTPLTVATTLAVVSTSTLNNGGNTLTISASGNNSVAGILAGAGALVKTGAGTLTLTAASGNNTANTYSGGTTINTGGSGTINLTGLTNITSTAITSPTQSVTFSTATPTNGTYQLFPGALSVGTQSFSHNANNTKVVTFNYSNSTVTVGSATITTGTINPTTYCAGASVSVPYTSSGTYSGTFTAQLSNASGSFGSPVTIGSGSSPITATIPSGTAAGTLYRIRVVNDNPAIIGTDNGTNIRVNALPSAPTASVSAQPTCTVATGTISVTLPTPRAGIAYTLTGTNPVVEEANSTTGTFSGLSAGVYSVTISNSDGCTSAATTGLTVNSQPATPSVPTASVSEQPTCTVATGTITVSAPANGSGITYTLTGTNPVVGATTNSNGTFSGLSAGIYSVTTTNAAGCTSDPTTGLTVNVQPATPSTPTITGSSTFCQGTMITLTSSATSGNQWYKDAVLIGGATASTLSVSTAGTYTVIVTVSGCSSAPSTGNTVSEGPAGETVWNGSAWDSGGVPTSQKTVRFTGNATITADLYGCSLTVDNNAVVTINTGVDVTLNGPLTVSSGSFTLNNDASLLQNSTQSNSGNIIVKRDSSLLMRQDYTLWSSPVASQNLFGFSPQTLTTRFYTYNQTSNLYSLTDMYTSGTLSGTSTFQVGRGYLIRMPNNHPTTPTRWAGQFTGVPNNGTKTVSLVTAGGGYTLVGNPYPSPIGINSFLSQNSIISSTLWFWRKTNGASGTAYVALTAGLNSGGQPTGLGEPSQTDDRFIQPGQGFFVKATTAGDLQFTNQQRFGVVDTFYRTNGVSVNTAPAVGRLWLHLKSNDVVVGAMAIGYREGATNDLDEAFDGKYINDSPLALTSFVQGEELSVQHRAVPFLNTDVVPLSFKTDAAGTYAIAINTFDGLFSGAEGQPIYLRDNLTGTVHDLNSGSYPFSAAIGAFTSRFEIVYQSSLNVSAPIFSANQVVVYANESNDFVINTGNTVMSSVKVFDIRGRLLYNYNEINATQTTVDVGQSNQVLLLQITAVTGEVVTKKVVR